MKVTVLNPEEVKCLFEHWGTFAKVCYDSKGSAAAIGKHCMASGHFSGSKERANEQARYVLPMSTHGAVAIGFTIESLIEYCHKRLCVRTEDMHHELAKMIRKEVVAILPELEEYLVAQCEYLTWCPEGKGCGRYQKRGEKK